jgi:Domain of unknown function (DU1801)
MTTLKTRQNRASVTEFLRRIPDPEQRRDAKAIHALMRRVTGAPARMWGSSIVGYGSYHYRYPSGREGDWFTTGFSPRKGTLTLYIMSGFPAHASLLKRLGRHKTGGSCLYIKRLTDIDLGVLERLIVASVRQLARRWPAQERHSRRTRK